MAGRIVDWRDAHGPFRRVEDLMKVKGIGEKSFANMEAWVAIEGETTLKEKVRSSRTSAPAEESEER